MALIADILLAAGAIGAAVYCLVLSNRLQRFTRLESGVGGAIAVLSAQVDDMTRALKEARAAAHSSETALAAQTARAEQATERLSLMLASMHDLPLPEAPAESVAQAHQAGAAPPAAAQADDPAPRFAHAETSAQHRPAAPEPAEPAAPPSATPPAAPPLEEGEGERRPRFLRRRAPPQPAALPEAAE